MKIIITNNNIDKSLENLKLLTYSKKFAVDKKKHFLSKKNIRLYKKTNNYLLTKYLNMKGLKSAQK